jgi:hypothetical protein
MSQSEPTPDGREIVEDLENDIVDVEGARTKDAAARKDSEGPDDATLDAAPDGTRAVPGSPEPPD